MRGFYSYDERLPDHDLGRCTVDGKRNFLTESHLGVPTVRHDIVAPLFEKRSIGNNINYGDDLGAYPLLFPNKWRFQGISEEDFQGPRGVNDLHDLFEKAGLKMEPESFSDLFQEAAAKYGDGANKVSLDAMIQVYSQKEFGTVKSL